MRLLPPSLRGKVAIRPSTVPETPSEPPFISCSNNTSTIMSTLTRSDMNPRRVRCARGSPYRRSLFGLRPTSWRLRPDPLSFVQGRASACFFLPDEKFLLLLPGEALRLVRRKTPRTDPTAGPSSTLHLYNPEGPPRTFRARTPLALPSLANRLRERPRVFPGALPA